MTVCPLRKTMKDTSIYARSTKSQSYTATLSENPPSCQYGPPDSTGPARLAGWGWRPAHRPSSRRYYLTAHGIGEAAGFLGFATPSDFVRACPVSREWLALLVSRMDAVAAVHRLAASLSPGIDDLRSHVKFHRRGRWRPFLLEFERRAPTPRRVAVRLKSYRRYFLSGWAKRDHDGLLPRTLFVFESPGSEDAFLHAARTLRGVPFLTTNAETVAERGILGSSWRESPSAPSSDRPNACS